MIAALDTKVDVAAMRSGPRRRRPRKRKHRWWCRSVKLLVMGRWLRNQLLPIVVTLLLVGGLGGAAVGVLYLPQDPRNDVLKLLPIGATLVIALLPLVWGRGGVAPFDSRPVEVLAPLLDQAVHRQWCNAADERRLVRPAPIPIRWSLSDLDVAGPVGAVVGVPDQLAAFPPLPGQTTITEQELRAGGGRRELHQLFAGLASGRIVVVGAPGAGKSGAAILLLLDALAHRNSLDDSERAQVPVPVLFTGHGWDPNTTSTQDWLRDRLVATYPMFQRHGGDADAAALAAAQDKIALILDGLDEMDETLRSTALEALSDVPFRVVVLTRGPEMIQAARKAWLVGAVAVQLHHVAGHEAADYLQWARTGPPPSDWPMLLAHLREHPESPLARGLSTPLALTLLRDTYHAGDDLGDLLDPTGHSTAEHIEQHLISRVLPAAYTPRPGRPPRYSETQARQALTFLAQQMNQDHTRDLAWWDIPQWASTMPRIFTTGLKHGLKYGLLYGLVCGAALGLVIALMVERTMISVVIGLAVGLLIGAIGGLIVGPMFGILGTFQDKLASGRFAYIRKNLKPRRIRSGSWRAGVSRQALRQGLVTAITFGLVVGLVLGDQAGQVIGLVGGLMFALASGIAFALIEDGISEDRSLCPREIWRNDRATALLLGIGIVPAYLFLFEFSSTQHLGLVAGLTYGLVGFVVLSLGLRSTTTDLAWRQLKLVGHAPAVSLMPFLEDARQRGVLRTVGGVYQFRHVTLQDQLASATHPNSAIARVS
jgi:hypothetical protein